MSFLPLNQQCNTLYAEQLAQRKQYKLSYISILKTVMHTGHFYLHSH